MKSMLDPKASKMTDKPVRPDPNHNAPYEAWPGVSAAPHCYYLDFDEGYQLCSDGWLMFDTTDPWIELTGQTEVRYPCVLTTEQLESIRHCPGVAKVTQFGDDEWLRERKVRWHPEQNNGKGHGYLVYFADEHYTVGEHLAKIGLTFEGVWKMSRTRDYNPSKLVTEEQLRIIHSDPKVLMIEETTGGTFC
ncbi:hypothetical protein B0A48_01906 [Cryoendolithus antarcticus]|uniref:Uncharacterized protein n=1 Tax=Cryoendolithus antarcticus TaxID=1507870 RepID=A0A1V8TQL2_9PEZI|nr:hypothetical protein B0A48_01906 [Cryoendolithus antarcticus]